MSEAEELKAFKQKLELKYGRLAKQRLAKLSKVADLDKQLIDMTDKEFDQQLDKWFSQGKDNSNQSNQSEQSNQQHRLARRNNNQ